VPTRRIAVMLAVALLWLPAPAQPASADAVSGATMLSMHNSFRAAIGAPAVAADARVERAAQAHADYLSMNNELGHYETQGRPGFTGVTARDRVAYQGYTASFVSENAASYSSAAQAVTELWHAPYHRLGMMHPHTIQAGWGHSSISGRERTVANFVKNYSSPAPDFVRSPAHGQVDIPTSWNGNESPSPLPAGAAKPTGYPVMVVYSRYQVVQMRSATITGPSGAVPIYYAPQEFETDYQAVIPQQPLASGTTYHVRFDLTVDGRAVTNEWDFTTAGLRPWNASWVSDNTPSRMVQGASQPVSVTVRNTGTNTWPAAQVRLSYHWVDEVTGQSVVWDGNRGTLPSDVARNQQVTVPINVAAPPAPGRYRLQYDLVYEGQFWFSWRSVPVLQKSVLVGDFGATYGAPASLQLGTQEETTVQVTLTNTGAATWKAAGTPALRLSYHLYTEAGAVAQWDGLRAALPNDVAPGQSVTVPIRLRAPAAAGTYRAEFDLLYEGFTWFSWQGTATGRTTVAVQTYGATYAPGQPPLIAPATQTSVPVTLTNTGSRTWSPPSFTLSYHLVDAAGRVVVWDGLRTALPQNVAPGQSVTVQAAFSLPTAGSYTIRWDLVQEGVTWFSWRGVPVGTSRVSTAPEYGASYSAPSAQSASSGQTLTPSLTITNTGWRTWSTAGFRLSYHIYDGAGRVLVWDGARTTLPQNVAMGQSVTLQANLTAPAGAGSYIVRWDIVQEAVTWFSWQGVAPAATTLTVN
jgi:hypothetical protein